MTESVDVPSRVPPLVLVSGPEDLLAERGMAEAGDVSALRDAWETAYLRTPHGAPVRLDDAPG